MNSNPSTKCTRIAHKFNPNLNRAKSSTNPQVLDIPCPKPRRPFLLPASQSKVASCRPFFFPADRSKAAPHFLRCARASPTDSEAHRCRNQPDPPVTRPRTKLRGGSMVPAVAVSPQTQNGTPRAETWWNGCDGAFELHGATRTGGGYAVVVAGSGGAN